MRYALATVSFLIVIARMVWPTLTFDQTSLILVVLAAAVLLLRDFPETIHRLRRFEWGNVKVELDEQLKNLATRTEKAEQEPSKSRMQIQKALPDDVLVRFAQVGSDPRASLVLLAVEIERAIRNLAGCYGLYRRHPQDTARALLSEIVAEGIVPQDIRGLFEDFWFIRDSVVHGVHFDVREGELYQLVDLGLRILKMLSASESQAGEQSEKSS